MMMLADEMIMKKNRLNFNAASFIHPANALQMIFYTYYSSMCSDGDERQEENLNFRNH